MLRLLATATLELKTFMGEIPPYAILSHTWLEEGEEVTLDDLKHGIGKARSKKGYPKLKDSARLAWLKGFAYIWIDTCCIDKASSAELSEAINSMYRWYKDAAVCYAYLADVLNANDNVEFKHSRWFTRGWTLQELIAPKQLHFYSASWEHIGSRDDLVRVIEDVTHVPRSVLGGGGSLDRVSAGAKLSWAAARVTTRAEDSAYCLMGILDVNMPLLYGEGGEKAFVRLQEEFLKSQDDESIFAWAAPSESVARDKHYWGLLAPSPAFFTGARSIRRPPFKTRIQRHPTSITNRGTSVELVLSSFQGDKSGTVYLGLLNLHATQDGDVLAIVLQRVSDIENQYVRIAADLLIKITFNLFGLPFACLSPRYNVEYSQRRDRAVIISPHLFDSGRAILRVGDPEPQLIFVPTASPRSELLAGFYLLPEIISETSSDSKVEMFSIICSSAWREGGPAPARRG